MKLNFVVDQDEPEAGQIFVETTFDGHPLNCFLDTGATSTKVVQDDFFSGYEGLRSAQLSGLAGKDVSAQKIRIRKVSIAEHQLGSHEVTRLPKELGMAPTAGVDLFQNQRFTIDSSKREVIFEEQEAELPFSRGTKGYIIIPVLADSLEIRTVWDTGAGLTTIDQKIIDANPSLFHFIKSLNVGDTVGPKAMHLNLYEMSQLKVGSLVLHKVKVLGVDFNPLRKRLNDPSLVGALGYNVISHFKWHFDMKKQKYSVK